MEYPVIAKSIGINWRLLYEISRSNTYINRPSPQKQEYNCKILQDEHYRFDFAQNVFTGSFGKFYKLYNTSKKFAYQNAMVNGGGGLLCTAFQIWMELGSVGRLRRFQFLNSQADL